MGFGPSPAWHAHRAQVAQLVEQGTENPRVGSSILSLGTTFQALRNASGRIIRLDYPLSRPAVSPIVSPTDQAVAQHWRAFDRSSHAAGFAVVLRCCHAVSTVLQQGRGETRYITHALDPSAPTSCSGVSFGTYPPGLSVHRSPAAPLLHLGHGHHLSSIGKHIEESLHHRILQGLGSSLGLIEGHL